MKSPMPQQMNEQIYDSRQHSQAIRQHAKSPDPILAARLQHHHRFDTDNQNRLQSKSPFTVDTGIHSQDVQQQLAQFYSPDVLEARDNIIRAPQRFEDHKLYGTSGTPADDRDIYMQRLPAMSTKYSQQQQLQYQQQQQQQSRMMIQSGYPNIERRTPDTYGRSKPDQLDRHFSDYEDIYNLGQQMGHTMQETSTYRRPMSPPIANNNKYIPNMPENYIPTHFEVINSI